ncbi:MAG: Serine/threonine-protein kinase pkn1 [Planctomycetota bacterium]
MLITLMTVTLLVGADADAERTALLKTFREEFIAITPGSGKFPAAFSMGREGGADSEQPVRTVTFKYSFQVARYEVPQNLWQAVMGNNPSKWKGKRNSVEMLSFDEAQDFCKRVTQSMREAKLIGADEEIRLPTEAEWEYVARAGTATVYSFGDDPAELTKYGWFNGNAAGNDPPVGAKQPNPWGLYDIHGYLREWCLDDWSDRYQDVPSDGSAANTAGSKTKVTRSGSWKDPAGDLSSSKRFKQDRNTRDDAIGLRCILAKVRP